MAVVALIPAHNEEQHIEQTILSVQRQSMPPRAIVVIADNCTDRTSEIAGRCGAVVFETVGNTARKAGALNQGLAYASKRYRSAKFILQMDADTVLDEHFVQRTVEAMEASPRIGGLGASFVGRAEPTSNVFFRFLVWSQRLEFVRFHSGQLTHQTSVLSGTASLLRVKTLLELSRSGGQVWDEDCIVEDYKLTKKMQKRGWLCMTDRSFVAHTDVMTTWQALIRQRLRWQSGTLQVIFRDFRGERCARFDAWRQRMTYALMIPHVAGYVFLLLALTIWGAHLASLLMVWAVLSLYEGWLARRLGWKSALFAATLLPLEFYNLLRYIWLVKGLLIYCSNTQLEQW
ncbi:MAG: glycosyltransferase family 2 protein [Actinomycetota bacterium]|nr:glycosyltransferase family 2 protein [Actinomycetota bacterium]